ncbi:Putative uncharacterized protein [Taphrina deformans PYCC 5710]|uniref:non-specific serine/threonine protein kinase n=1 Tax=Taphrina deformans (strain PYCC 5710 / ATCC 11124 / CBS 356.35 / IMI 108563 / JCM 9778 / NBRC 8474) TaxID=1097556 RepID=R4XBT7_TAPDE|nr:Putative uncharacterized protein [Taphrina deformans PYCC 5710]|eukprot:CCG81841.1 Putative uncharacterized protein [Taphrina deformans PYCC 5710]
MEKDIGQCWDEFEIEVDEDERAAFERVTSDYLLISKIGEGTFSTVYKAEDCHQQVHDNSWLDSRGGNRNASYYVAIKRIYVTSSPQRIYNELDILRSLSGSDNVLPMITAFRHEDQVFVVLPYFKHIDFRNYYRVLPLRDVRYYMRSLFLALEDVHAVNVIHRDIKPTNFLYDVQGRKGELVDFGLAERQQVHGQCPCRDRSGQSTEQMLGMINPTHAKLRGVHLKDDQRPGKRANRAGTRGFRAPEVLFKCDSQFTAVDIWSAGVILLTFLSCRFPFFNSNDDIEALIEIASIFGKDMMKQVAAQHDCSFESTLPTLHERSISFTRLVHWSNDSTNRLEEDNREQNLAIDFMARCLTLDPWQRWSASEALQDEFLLGIEADDLHDARSELDIGSQFETGGLESAADIDPLGVDQVLPSDHTIGNMTVDKRRAPAVFDDSTSEARPAAKGRPKEFVFLKTDDYPDDNLHSQMRQQLISNVNSMRAKREASLKSSHYPSASSLAAPRNLASVGRARSASATMGQSLTRPVTPLHQILPNSPSQNMLPSKGGNVRAKSLSPGKATADGVSTIDPRLTQLQENMRTDIEAN